MKSYLVSDTKSIWLNKNFNDNEIFSCNNKKKLLDFQKYFKKAYIYSLIFYKVYIGSNIFLSTRHLLLLANKQCNSKATSLLTN